LVKVRDLIHIRESNGWYVQRTKGSHRQFRHPEKGLVVTVAGQSGKDIPQGTLRAILRSTVVEKRQEE